MPQYLDDPSVLTKEKLKNELLAHNVELPGSSSPKDVYVQLYLKNLTVQNTTSGGAPDGGGTLDGFSSDEDLPPPVVSSRSSGRKAIRKTDKVQIEALDVAELTAEGLKEELMKYGVDAGPIVASTRRVYEKKLQRLQEESVSPVTPELPLIVMETEVHHNGHADVNQFSDQEDEVVLVVPIPEPEVIPEPEPLPEPIPIVERLVRSRGKIPVTTRTRSSQHHKSSVASEDEEVLNVKRPFRRTSYRVEPVPSPACQTVGPNNVCSVLEPELQPHPGSLVTQAQTEPAPSPSGNTQRSSEDSATLRLNCVALKGRQPKTPRIQPSGEKTPRIQLSGEKTPKTPRIQPSGEKTPKTQPSGAPGPPKSPKIQPSGATMTPKTKPSGAPGPLKTQPSGASGPPKTLKIQPSGAPGTPKTQLSGAPGLKDQSRRTTPPALMMKGTLHTTVAEGPQLTAQNFLQRAEAVLKRCVFHKPSISHPSTPTLLLEKEQTNTHVTKGKQQKNSHFLPDLSPVRRHGCVAIVTKQPYFNKVEKVVVVDQTLRAEERDILKEVFANDLNSPSGIIASCRKPIRGAAGRPIQPSDFWQDENLLLSPKSLLTTTTTTSSFSETRHRSSNLFPSTDSTSIAPSTPRLVLAAPPAGHAPAGHTPAARRGLSVLLKVFLLVLLVSFLFFVYQTMEGDFLSPFSQSEAEPTGTTESVA